MKPLYWTWLAAASVLATHAAADETEAAFLDTHRCLDCEMQQIDFSSKSYTLVDLSRSTLKNVDFSDTGLFLAVFEEAQIEKTSFRNAQLNGATFAKAVLRDVDFRGANLTGATFSGADVDEEQLNEAVKCNTLMPDGFTLATEGC